MKSNYETVSNPKVAGAAAEATAATAAQERSLEGYQGEMDSPRSVAAEKLIVEGKGPLEELPQYEYLAYRRRRGAGPTIGIESVILTDDRVRILTTESVPWRMLCCLEIDAPFGGFLGSGWMAGPRTVITAGHCVFSSNMGGWASSIRVSPGRDAAEAPFGAATATRFETLKRWEDHEEADYDYGVIHLDEPLGDRTGWFGISSLSDADLRDSRVNVSGYPADKPLGTQWFHANRVLATTPRRIFYDVDTYGGQSGAPVWIQNGATQSVVAIHAYGIGGTPVSLGITANSAPRISADVFEVIRGWIENSGT